MIAKEKRTKGFIRSIGLLGLLVYFFSPSFAIGTTGVLNGKVLEKETGKAIEKVLITAKSSSDTFTAVSDFNGFFSMVSVPAGVYTLILERVGYQTSRLADTVVNTDATTNLILSLVSQPVVVPGETVITVRSPLVSSRNTMTDYGYTQKESNQVLPAAKTYQQIPLLYETLPGVQVSYDAYYGSAAPHIRGGTGSDIAYAFDGILTYEPISNTFGTNLMNVGTSSTNFYTGAYPAQYGNFVSGFVNQIAQRGYGPAHANFSVQYGAWLDQGSQLPSYAPNSGIPNAYPNSLASNPTLFNFELSGKDRRFGYYLGHLIQDQGLVSYSSGVDLKPLLTESLGGGIQNRAQTRDTVLNLTYDLDEKNGLQMLYYLGLQNASFAGFQELPCNPNDPAVTNCSGTNTKTGFGETFNPYQITALSDTHQNQTYSLWKTEWTHRFQKPGSSLNFRVWKYDPTVFFNFFDLPNTAWQFRHAGISGILLEHQNQLTPQHLLDMGVSWSYAHNYVQSSALDIGYPDSTDRHFNSAQAILFNSSNPPGTILNATKVPDTQTWGAWLSDQWRPSEKLVIDAGLRYDRQNYLSLTGTGISTASSAQPFVLNTLCPGTVTGVCFDANLLRPSRISPRVGISYKFSDKLTLKSGYGKFITFAPSRRVEYVGQVTGSSSAIGAQNGTLPAVNSLAAFMNTGSKPQLGESLDVGWEYQLDPNTFFRVTPYLKHMTDPLESVIVAGTPSFFNAGTIESKGIEFFLKSRDWHNLSGWISYTYSSTKGSQIPFETGVEGSLIGAPGSPFTLASVTADNNQIVPMNYDERHMLNINLNYKVGRWEISPGFQYGSGLPYGLGANNLRALAAVQNPNSVIYGGSVPVPANSSSINPLGETGFNGLRAPGWWLGNLAITYHLSDHTDAVFTVLNILNSNQVIGRDNQTTPVYQASASTFYDGYVESSVTNPSGLGLPTYANYSSMDGSQKIFPQYNPNQGQYAPVGFPNLRQFYFTLQYHY